MGWAGVRGGVFEDAGCYSALFHSSVVARPFPPPLLCLLSSTRLSAGIVPTYLLALSAAVLALAA